MSQPPNLNEDETSSQRNRGMRSKGISGQKLRDPITGQFVKEVGAHSRSLFKRGAISMESAPRGSKPTQ